MVTVIAGIIPEWENRKLFTYLSDRVINMIHQRGYKTNVSICYNPRAKTVLLNFYLGKVINDLDIRKRIVDG